MASTSTFVSIKSGLKLVATEPEFTNVPERPKTWFDNHPGQKPLIDVTLSQGSALTIARSWAHEFILTGAGGPRLILEYLYQLARETKGTLTAEWKSYNIIIPPGEITPLSFVEIRETSTESVPLVSSPRNLNEDSDTWILCYVTGLYRMSMAHPQQLSVLKDRLRELARSHGAPQDFAINASTLQLISVSPEVVKMIAAYDMFFEVFPKHKYAVARIGTIITRYQGCSAFLNAKLFKSMTGSETIEKAAEWIYSDSICKEISTLFKEVDMESLNRFSYFPYMMGLGLVNKSAYAASSSPYFHTLVHGVGCLTGNKRSINAVLIKCPIGAALPINMAIIFLSRCAAISVDAVNAEALRMDSLTDGISALSYYKKKNQRFSRASTDQLTRCVASIRNPRKGTVGLWMKNYFLTFFDPVDSAVNDGF